MKGPSPELILIDPELASQARLELPEARDCLSRSARQAPSSVTPSSGSTAPTAPTASPPSFSGGSPRARVKPSLLAVVGTVLTVVVIGSPALDLLPLRAERPSFAAEPGRVVERSAGGPDAVRLRWRKVRGADFYDVVLWRDGRRITDLWPRTNAVQIGERSGSQGGALEPGKYQWFAFPAFRESGSTRFGPSVGRGEFSVE